MKKLPPRAENLRRALAQEAARIMSEHGIRDFLTAKRKAAERFGVTDGSVLPKNIEIEDALAERLPPGELADLGGAEGLIRSPEVVRELPPDLHDVVVEAVQISVTSVYRWVAPVALILLVLALLVRETPLRTTSSIGGTNGPASPESPASPASQVSSGDGGPA